ncbi:hypothetical protein T12_295 [Trichinella patagoniensis]|uniref:Uncharacterized protein n=1 Tax=Trichinella patagoniensis TaxID=990121 RepID=A0A0V0ZT27_9BILA|nr:hypothetical protein T12_295 [Trichinella patagoniensis]
MTRVPSIANPSTLTDLAAFIYYDGRFSSTQDQDQRQLARSKTRVKGCDLRSRLVGVRLVLSCAMLPSSYVVYVVAVLFLFDK